MKALKKGWKKYKYPYLFMAPAVFLLLCFSILPIAAALLISFTNMDLKGLADYANVHMVGLHNYATLFQDPVFYQAAFNTAYYVVIGVPLVVVFSLGIAVLLNMGSNRLFRGCRILYYAPAVTNAVAVAVVWGFLYNSNYGVFNTVLKVLHLPTVAWLLNPWSAKASLILLAVWKNLGFNMLIFLAALKGIPRTYYEAAKMDGASGFRQLKAITLPLMGFSIFFVTITTLIGWIQFFAEPMVMTKGGPLNSTLSLALMIYNNGFKQSQFGYAAAGSFILFAVIIVVTAAQFRLKKDSVEY